MIASSVERLQHDSPPTVSERRSVRIVTPDEFRRERFALPNLSPEFLPFGSQCQDACAWLRVLDEGLGHRPYCLQLLKQEAVVGLLPLALVKSALFGRFLVSLPYLNSAGLITTDEENREQLISQAVKLADELDVRYLELRHENDTDHAALTAKNSSKVIMRLPLPKSRDELWDSFRSKLRSQIRSGQKHDFQVAWGGEELLPEFYNVFSRNMRDLGTPVYPIRLFTAILRAFHGNAELCVVRLGGKAVASALLVHKQGVTEVPSASSLRTHNASNANMVMYWQLLSRAIERGQATFDFGRSTIGSGTYRFKEQWGAKPHPSVWQYYVRRGSVGDMRPDNAKFGLAIKIWQRLPVYLTRVVGPAIVRGIP